MSDMYCACTVCMVSGFKPMMMTMMVMFMLHNIALHILPPTQSYPVSFGRPSCLVPSSALSLRRSCPNHFNLLFLLAKLTCFMYPRFFANIVISHISLCFCSCTYVLYICKLSYIIAIGVGVIGPDHVM